MSVYLFTLSMCMIACALILKSNKQTNLSLITLTVAGFVLRYTLAADPFLHEWDERFHALVARNMMDHPLKPMLFKDPLIDYDYTGWCYNHIWLHKQPLFLWQMALSMKILGVSELTMRLPSVILGTLTVPLTYRIAKLYTTSKYVPFTAALFICLSGYQLELISGYNGMDHNDVSFSFYVLASIWTYLEYNRTKKWYWAILTGVFSGSAILTKWLTGLLVYSGWGINLLLSIKQKGFKRETGYFLLSLGICAAIVIPWQVYIIHEFPKEAAYEYAHNTRHIYEAVEGHSGHNEYYLNRFPEYFGRYIWVMVLTGFLISIFKKGHNKESLALGIYIATVYSFFSFVVQTKVSAYFFVVAPIGFIYIATTIDKVIQKLPSKITGATLIGALVICGGIILTPVKLFKNHGSNKYRDIRVSNATIYRDLHKYLPPNVKVVINAHVYNNIDIMFYNNDLNVYQYCFSEEEFDVAIKKHKTPVAVFKYGAEHKIPEYITQYKKAYIIEAPVCVPAKYKR